MREYEAMKGLKSIKGTNGCDEGCGSGKNCKKIKWYVECGMVWYGIVWYNGIIIV